MLTQFPDIKLIYNNLKFAALRYADNCIPVLPLVPGHKEPLTWDSFQHGFKDATLDATLIRECWEANPDANIGLRMGVERPDGSIVGVIDEDNKDSKECQPAKDGHSDMLDLSVRLGALPPTRTVLTTSSNSETGHRGKQYYVNVPAILNNATLKAQLAYGVDLKFRDCYVVAPPSVVNGQMYEFESSQDELCELPEAWAAGCIKPAPRIIRTKTSGMGGTICERYGINMFDVIDIPASTKKSGDWYTFTHPIHDSSNGTNIHVKSDGSGWKCWRHETGGDALTWVAVREGFMSCGHAGPLDIDTLKECLAVLRREGLIEDEDDKPFGARRGGR